MTISVDRAAADLLRQIHAPDGAVNTIGVVEHRKKIIRVLVDQNYWYRLGAVPKTFKGFTVRVEKRGAIDVGPSDRRAHI